MKPAQKRKVILAIVVMSALMVIIYDFRHILKNRALPCDLKIRNCPSGFVCSSTDTQHRPRCLPKASAPNFSFDIPYASGVPVQCLAGNQDGTLHTTDDSVFAVQLQSQEPLGVKIAEEKKASIVAAADGSAYVDAERKIVKILHKEGYYSVYQGLSSVAAKEGLIRSGDLIGSSLGPITFSVHFINPDVAEEILKQSKALGISVPFQFRLSLDPRGSSNLQLTSSESLACSQETSVRLFRANIPL